MEEAHPECSPAWIPRSTRLRKTPFSPPSLVMSHQKAARKPSGGQPAGERTRQRGFRGNAGCQLLGMGVHRRQYGPLFSFFFFFSSCNRSNRAQHPYHVSAFGLNLEEEGKRDPEMKSKLHVSSVASWD